jgi:hypothetical protein
MDIPITKKVHAFKSTSKEEICPTCKEPIGNSKYCDRPYLHVRGGK